MKKACIILLVFCSFLAYSQVPRYATVGLNKGRIKDGRGDFYGNIYLLEANMPIIRSGWISFTGRIAATDINRVRTYGNYYTYEKSNGINFEPELNVHLRFYAFDVYPSAALSFRYADNQHISQMGYTTEMGTGRVYDFHVIYIEDKGFYTGFTLGLNVDLNLTRHLILGARWGGMAYADYGYSYKAICLKYRFLNSSQIKD